MTPRDLNAMFTLALCLLGVGASVESPVVRDAICRAADGVIYAIRYAVPASSEHYATLIALQEQFDELRRMDQHHPSVTP